MSSFRKYHNNDNTYKKQTMRASNNVETKPEAPGEENMVKRSYAVLEEDLNVNSLDIVTEILTR